MAPSESISSVSIQSFLPHESSLHTNAASSKVSHALEKKAQEFGIYKTTYPDGTPRNPAISDKTDLEATF